MNEAVWGSPGAFRLDLPQRLTQAGRVPRHMASGVGKLMSLLCPFVWGHSRDLGNPQGPWPETLVYLMQLSVSRLCWGAREARPEGSRVPSRCLLGVSVLVWVTMEKEPSF